MLNPSATTLSEQETKQLRENYVCTTLVTAIENGDLTEIVRLIEEGFVQNIDIEITGIAGCDTPLIYAIRHGQLKIARYLIGKGAKIDYFFCINQPLEYETALMRAAREGDLDMVKLLLQFDADVAKCDGEGDTALIYAIRHRQFNVAQYLISQGADVNQGADDYKIGIVRNQTALIRAARAGDLVIITHLFAFGAKVNIEGNGGATALMYAVGRNHFEVVRYLVEQGADLEIKVDDGDTALIHAIRCGHLEIARYLIDQGANVNVRGYHQETALTIVLNKLKAVSAERAHEYLELAKHLIDQGGDGGQDVCNPVAIYAARSGSVDIVAYLFERGINRLTRFSVVTALHTAAAFGYLDIVEYLVEQGIDVDSELMSQTALMIAAARGRFEIVKYLIEQGACVNAEMFADSVLEASLRSEDVKIVSLLRAYGARYCGEIWYKNRQAFSKALGVALDENADANAAVSAVNTIIVNLAAGAPIFKIFVPGYDSRSASDRLITRCLEFKDSPLTRTLLTRSKDLTLESFLKTYEAITTHKKASVVETLTVDVLEKMLPKGYSLFDKSGQLSTAARLLMALFDLYAGGASCNAVLAQPKYACAYRQRLLLASQAAVGEEARPSAGPAS